MGEAFNTHKKLMLKKYKKWAVIYSLTYVGIDCEKKIKWIMNKYYGLVWLALRLSG
jgi:hypothetical protein